MKPSLTLFDATRMTMDEAIGLTVEALNEYGLRYRDWAIAWSGGKDSSALLACVVWLIETGQVRRPESLVVMYADTRMELPPLAIAATTIQTELRRRDIACETVLGPLDERFWVYMLGRGVPPPKNDFRWCTSQMKIEPMERALASLRARTGNKILMLTGVRLGESARRNETISVACGRDGAECGQGWLHLSPDKKNLNNINQYFVPSADDGITDTLAPILHWRTCLVWDWLTADGRRKHRFPTSEIAFAYDAGEYGDRVETSARTGCICCPLASDDHALRRIIRQPSWAHLAPLFELRTLWLELRKPGRRLRKPGGEARKDGTLSRNQNRMGPLTLDTRRWALDFVLDLQRRVNVAAAGAGRPALDILNAEEESRIRELIDANTWPQRWSGNEPVADEPYEDHYPDGSVQLLLNGKAVSA